MKYSRFSKDERQLVLESPVVMKDRSSERTVEELKNAETLTKERLEEAPAYVSMSPHLVTGLTIDIPIHVSWDEVQNIWFWVVEWRKLLSRFYAAKEKRRASRANPRRP